MSSGHFLSSHSLFAYITATHSPPPPSPPQAFYRKMMTNLQSTPQPTTNQKHSEFNLFIRLQKQWEVHNNTNLLYIWTALRAVVHACCGAREVALKWSSCLQVVNMLQASCYSLVPEAVFLFEPFTSDSLCKKICYIYLIYNCQLIPWFLSHRSDLALDPFVTYFSDNFEFDVDAERGL